MEATDWSLRVFCTAGMRWFMRTAGRSAVKTFHSASQARGLVASSDFVIDALLGTGISSEVTGHYRNAIDLLNEAQRPVIAVDIPSGIHADSGAVMGRAVRASMTVTFGLPKLGLVVR